MSSEFHFASRISVPLSTRILTILRAFYVVLYKDNPLLWSWRHGSWNPQADLEGPFYLIRPPDRQLEGQEGRAVLANEKALKEWTPFLFAGKVLGQDGTPVAGATMTFWQADPAGVYDFSAYRLRGNVRTAADGSFQVLSVTPGPYGPKGKLRAGHFHLVITPPAQASANGKRYQELTTQGYVCRANNPSWLHSDFINIFRAPRPSLVLNAYYVPPATAPTTPEKMTLPPDIPDFPIFSASADPELAQAIQEWDARLEGAREGMRVGAASRMELRLSEA